RSWPAHSRPARRHRSPLFLGRASAAALRVCFRGSADLVFRRPSLTASARSRGSSNDERSVVRQESRFCRATERSLHTGPHPRAFGPCGGRVGKRTAPEGSAERRGHCPLAQPSLTNRPYVVSRSSGPPTAAAGHPPRSARPYRPPPPCPRRGAPSPPWCPL